MSIDFRISDFFYPTAIWRMKRFLDRTQRLDAGVLRDYQDARLREMVQHAYANVPYYRELFDTLKLKPNDFEGVSDLPKLPVLTKETVRANLEKLRATNAAQFAPRSYRTSGSTGTPLIILHDRPSNIAELASYWWHWSWAGYRLGQKFLALRPVGFQMRHRIGGKLWHVDSRMRCLYLSYLKFKPDDVELYAERIRKFKPKFLQTRPALLALLANALKERGITDIHLNAIFTGGANRMAGDARLCDEVFHCKLYDSYGLMERVVNIRECEQGSYHINQVCGAVEVLDEAGDPVATGRRGRIVATGLQNWAMPLIRYDTKDFCVRENSDLCPCGRTLPRISSIHGLAEDPVVLPDGRHLAGLGYVFHVAWGIKVGQLVQTKRDSLEVRVVKDASYRDRDGAALLEQLRERVGPGIDLSLKFVEQIEPSEEGKFKWVKSEIA